MDISIVGTQHYPLLQRKEYRIESPLHEVETQAKYHAVHEVKSRIIQLDLDVNWSLYMTEQCGFSVDDF